MLLWSWPHQRRGYALRSRCLHSIPRALRAHLAPSAASQTSDIRNVNEWDVCVTQPAMVLHSHWLHTELSDETSMRLPSYSSMNYTKDVALPSLRIRIAARAAAAAYTSPSKPLSLPLHYALLCAVLHDGVSLEGHEGTACMLNRASHDAWAALGVPVQTEREQCCSNAVGQEGVRSIAGGSTSTRSNTYPSSRNTQAHVETYVRLIHTLLRHDTLTSTSLTVSHATQGPSNITAATTTTTAIRQEGLLDEATRQALADVHRVLSRVPIIPANLLTALLRSITCPPLLRLVTQHVIAHSPGGALSATQFARMLAALLLNENFRSPSRFAAMDAILREVLLPSLRTNTTNTRDEEEERGGMTVRWGSLLVRWTQVYGRGNAGMAFYEVFQLLRARQPGLEARLPTTFYVRLIGLLLDAAVSCEAQTTCTDSTQKGEPNDGQREVWPTMLTILAQAMRLCGHDQSERRRIWVITLKAALTLPPLTFSPHRLLAAHHICATVGCTVQVDEQALQQLLRLVCGALQQQQQQQEQQQEDSMQAVQEEQNEGEEVHELSSSSSNGDLVRALATFLTEQSHLPPRRVCEAAAMVLTTLWQGEGMKARGVAADLMATILPRCYMESTNTNIMSLLPSVPLLARVLADFQLSVDELRTAVAAQQDGNNEAVSRTSTTLSSMSDSVHLLALRDDYVWRCLLEDEANESTAARESDDDDGDESSGAMTCCGQWNEATATHCARCHRVRLHTKYECRLRARAWRCEACGLCNRAVDVLLCPHCHRGLQPMDECAICHLPHYSLSCCACDGVEDGGEDKRGEEELLGACS